MRYDGESGRMLMEKYLGTPELKTRKEHTEGVAGFAYKVALRIKERNP